MPTRSGAHWNHGADRHLKEYRQSDFTQIGETLDMAPLVGEQARARVDQFETFTPQPDASGATKTSTKPDGIRHSNAPAPAKTPSAIGR